MKQYQLKTKKKAIGTVLIESFSSRDSIEHLANPDAILRQRIKSAIDKIKTSPSTFKNIKRLAKSPDDLRSTNLQKHQQRFNYLELTPPHDQSSKEQADVEALPYHNIVFQSQTSQISDFGLQHKERAKSCDSSFILENQHSGLQKDQNIFGDNYQAFISKEIETENIRSRPDRSPQKQKRNFNDQIGAGIAQFKFPLYEIRNESGQVSIANSVSDPREVEEETKNFKSSFPQKYSAVEPVKKKSVAFSQEKPNEIIYQTENLQQDKKFVQLYKKNRNPSMSRSRSLKQRRNTQTESEMAAPIRLLSKEMENARANLSEDEVVNLADSSSSQEELEKTETQNINNNNRNIVAKVFGEFKTFYAPEEHVNDNSKQKWVISQSNSLKVCWDLFILVVLIFISISVPYRITFIEKDSKGWFTVFTIVDVCFGIDILLTFNTSFTDKILAKDVFDRKKIALNYLKGWLIIDIISVVPFDAFFTKGGVSSLAKFARFGRLYKIIRILRLAKLFKILKSKNTWQSQINTSMKIDTGNERLLFLGFFLVLFFHICACAYVLLADFIAAGKEDVIEETWLSKLDYQNATDRVKYLTSLYFIVSTVATVGYGDIAATNQYEKLFVIALMVIGVTIFSFVSGSLASIISNYDFQQAQLQEKLLYLNKLRTQYKISKNLFSEIQKVLTYDYKTNLSGLDIFIQQLPNHLRLQISRDIHRDTFKTFKLFKDIGGKHFLGWLGSRLKPKLLSEKQFIYQEGDIADSFYFQTKGVSAFFMPQRSAIFAIVNPEKYSQSNIETRERVFQYFGFEDTVINHTQLLIDFEDEIEIRTNVGGAKNMTRRHYNLQCIQNSECLVLTFEDIDRMKRDFIPISRKFIKKQMQQTKWLMAFHLRVLKQGKEKEKEQKLKQMENSIISSKNTDSNDKDMYSTLTWSETESSQSIVDFNEEEEANTPLTNFGESFKKKLGLGKSESKLKTNLPLIEENTDADRKNIFKTQGGDRLYSPMHFSEQKTTSKKEKVPSLQEASRNEFKMEMMKVISLQRTNKQSKDEQNCSALDLISSNITQSPESRRFTEPRKKITRQNTVLPQESEVDLLSPFQKRKGKKQKKPFQSPSPQIGERTNTEQNGYKETKISSANNQFSHSQNQHGQNLSPNQRDSTFALQNSSVLKSNRSERVYTKAQKKIISQIAAKASKFHGIDGLSCIFKEVWVAQRIGLLPRPEYKGEKATLIKRLKSNFRHKLDNVSQDMRVGAMLKKQKTKILDSIMSEIQGNIILKIQNPDLKNMQTYFTEKMEGLEERLNTKQINSNPGNSLAEQIQQAMRQQTEILATFMKSVECKLDKMNSEMHSLTQKVELMRNDD